STYRRADPNEGIAPPRGRCDQTTRRSPRPKRGLVGESGVESWRNRNSRQLHGWAREGACAGGAGTSPSRKWKPAFSKSARAWETASYSRRDRCLYLLERAMANG